MDLHAAGRLPGSGASRPDRRRADLSQPVDGTVNRVGRRSGFRRAAGRAGSAACPRRSIGPISITQRNATFDVATGGHFEGPEASTADGSEHRSIRSAATQHASSEGSATGDRAPQATGAWPVNCSLTTQYAGGQERLTGAVPQPRMKYLASGWWTTMAEVDCSGWSWNSSETVTPMRPISSSSATFTWSSRSGQAG